MPLHDQLVDVGRICRVERLEGEVIDRQQVDAQQLAHLGVVAVVEAAGPQPAQHPVAALEVHAVAAAHGGMAEGTG